MQLYDGISGRLSCRAALNGVGGRAAPDPAFSVLHVGAVGHTGLLGPVCDPCVVSSCLDDTKKENVVNPIMIDGTGMCGGCRVTVGGKTRFACVDGPEFDGHQVDYDELMLRLQAYCEDEQKCYNEFCMMQE